MPFNGSGVFQRVRNWVADATAGIKIRADYHDNEDDGFAAGLTNCITRDGQSIITQNIPFNSKRITGLQDPVNPQDAATKLYTDNKVANPGVITGDITIRKGSPSLIFDGTDSGGQNLHGKKNDKQRWLLRLGNDVAETGSHVGSNLDLHRYGDDGSYLGQALQINRASGVWTITGAVNIAGDLHTDRGPEEGVVFLGSSGTHYVYWAAGQYSMPGGPLLLGANATAGGHAVTLDQLNTKQASLGFTPVQQSGGIYQQPNKVYIGWDGTALRAQVDGTDLGRFFNENTTAPVSDGRLAHAGDVAFATGPQSSIYEPYGGSVITGYSWVIITYPLVGSFRYRYMQLFRSGWFTVGYA